MVMLKELRSVKRVFIEQERGDILYVPAWWIHTTIMKDENLKSANFNIHILAEGSVLSYVTEGVRKFGMTTWLFRGSTSTSL